MRQIAALVILLVVLAFAPRHEPQIEPRPLPVIPSQLEPSFRIFELAPRPTERVAISDVFDFRVRVEPVAYVIPETKEITTEYTAPPSIRESHNYALDNNDRLTNGISWATDCEDGNPYTGFEMYGFCIPGVIDKQSWMFSMPGYSAGMATYYAPGVMQHVADNRSMSLDGYVGGLVVMSCKYIGRTAYIRRPGMNWEGPFLILDCSKPEHLYLNLVYLERHIEVDKDIWDEWSATTGTGYIELCIGGRDCAGNPQGYVHSWLNNLRWLTPVDEAGELYMD